MRQTGLIALLSAAPLGACLCGTPPPCSTRGPDAVIFVGIPLEERLHTDPGEQRSVWFQVERPIRGLPPAAKRIAVDASLRTSCAAGFEPDVRYLVFAQRDPSWRRFGLALLTNWYRSLRYGSESVIASVWTTQCLGSRPVTSADPELACLR